MTDRPPNILGKPPIVAEWQVLYGEDELCLRLITAPDLQAAILGETRLLNLLLNPRLALDLAQALQRRARQLLADAPPPQG